MSLHLFSTPVQCTHCGTVVDDPTLDRCPKCGNLLKERRTPRRLAGVEKRYGNLRFLVGLLRFLGVITVLIGALVFFSIIGDAHVGRMEQVYVLLASLVGAAALWSLAAFFELAIDVEENTRSSFRLQQLMLEHWQEELPGGGPIGGARPPVADPAVANDIVTH
jgi:hypothetical protein